MPALVFLWPLQPVSSLHILGKSKALRKGAAHPEGGEVEGDG
jgi:hypothetical protein